MAPSRLTVVDSSAWIDYLNEARTWQTATLDDLIRDEQHICLVDLILVEVLRGFRDDEEAANIASGLLAFPFLDPISPGDHIKAAQIYRLARAAGIAVAGTVDLVICATCIRHGATLLHADRDFDQLASLTDLKVWAPDD